MAVVILLCVIFCILWLMYWKKKSSSGIPGPSGYPLIGNSLEVNEKNLHVKFEEWGNKYGDIFQVNIFGQNMIVLNTANRVRGALLTEPHATIFSNRLKSVVGKHFLYHYSDIAFSGYSPQWKKRKKLGHRLLNAYGEGIKVIETNIQNEINEDVKRIRSMNGSPFDPDEIISDFLYGIITILIMGRRFDSGSETVKFLRRYDQLLLDMGNLGINFLLTWLPFLAVLPGPISTLYKTCRDEQMKFNKMMMQEVVNVNKYHGMIHCLLKEQSEHCSEDGKPWPSDDEILGILADMEVAGVMTSKELLLSLVSILVTRPDVQEKMQAEVDKIIGAERQPTIHDRPNMPYMQAVIMETLRYISHLPLLLPRETSSDTELAGYFIPKGTTVVINAWKIHHDEAVWNSPWDFIPERFLDKNGGLLGVDTMERKSFMAFGIGKRSCIGENFARSRIFLFMTKMMQNFTFVPEGKGLNNEQFNPRNMKPGLILMAKQYKCRVINR